MPIMDIVTSLKDDQVKTAYNTVVETLKKFKFNKTKTARALKIDRKTLYNILDRHEALMAAEEGAKS